MAYTSSSHLFIDSGLPVYDLASFSAGSGRPMRFDLDGIERESEELATLEGGVEIVSDENTDEQEGEADSDAGNIDALHLEPTLADMTLNAGFLGPVPSSGYIDIGLEHGIFIPGFHGLVPVGTDIDELRNIANIINDPELSLDSSHYEFLASAGINVSTLMGGVSANLETQGPHPSLYSVGVTSSQALEELGYVNVLDGSDVDVENPFVMNFAVDGNLTFVPKHAQVARLMQLDYDEPEPRPALDLDNEPSNVFTPSRNLEMGQYAPRPPFALAA